jgi:Ca-activated chloride channel family protein
VHQDNKREIINVQKINKPEKYLVGKYDIEILTLPRIIMEDIDIKPDNTTTIEIPASGIVTLTHRAIGYGSVYVRRGDELEWVYNLDEDKYSETLYLLPGNYIVVFRSRGVYETIYTESKNFKVYSRRSQQVTIDYN